MSWSLLLLCSACFKIVIYFLVNIASWFPEMLNTTSFLPFQPHRVKFEYSPTACFLSKTDSYSGFSLFCPTCDNTKFYHKKRCDYMPHPVHSLFQLSTPETENGSFDEQTKLLQGNSLDCGSVMDKRPSEGYWSKRLRTVDVNFFLSLQYPYVSKRKTMVNR